MSPSSTTSAAPTATASTCTTNTGTYNFNGGVNITVNGTGAFGFRAQSSGTVNILNPDGDNQITSNNGTALLINPTTLNATLELGHLRRAAARASASTACRAR